MRISIPRIQLFTKEGFLLNLRRVNHFTSLVRLIGQVALQLGGWIYWDRHAKQLNAKINRLFYLSPSIPPFLSLTQI